MTPKQVELTIVFLGRTDLKGHEAPMFMEIIKVLQKQMEDNQKTDGRAKPGAKKKK